MIGKATQVITAIAIPIVSAGCVLAFADSQLFSSGASTSSRPSDVTLLDCTPNPSDAYSCVPKPPPVDENGCPLDDPTSRALCVLSHEVRPGVPGRPAYPLPAPPWGPFPPYPLEPSPGELPPGIIGELPK
jgi:hypothetical protein